MRLFQTLFTASSIPWYLVSFLFVYLKRFCDYFANLAFLQCWVRINLDLTYYLGSKWHLYVFTCIWHEKRLMTEWKWFRIETGGYCSAQTRYCQRPFIGSVLIGLFTLLLVIPSRLWVSTPKYGVPSYFGHPLRANSTFSKQASLSPLVYDALHMRCTDKRQKLGNFRRHWIGCYEWIYSLEVQQCLKCSR